jgi:hypothetical protein
MSLGRTVGGGRVFNPPSPECARLRARLAAMHRRAQAAESIAGATLETLRREGQQNLGRGFANSAAAMYEGQRDDALAECARLREALADVERLVAFHHEPALRGAKAGDPCPICAERGALNPETAAFAKARSAEARP